MATELLERVDEKTGEPKLDNETPKFAHYTDKEKIVDAYVVGTPLIALCGYVWVPSRDPKNYPICPECQRLYDLGPEGRMNERRSNGGEQ